LQQKYYRKIPSITRALSKQKSENLKKMSGARYAPVRGIQEN
jgi:hypothetical protein